MNITVFGTGYVGLVTGSCLADAGHHVTCVDIDNDKIEKLKKGIIPIFEPGLEAMVLHNIAEHRLSFTTQPEQAVKGAQILFIAVGTPPDEDGSADLRYVLDVASTIAEHIEPNQIIVTKSTVPVGTADKVADAIHAVLQRNSREITFHVASNPEFLKEGAAVTDFSRPDRIIVGTDSPFVEAQMRKLYTPFNRLHDKLIFMDIRSAELTKYAANCFLATKISFINEMANLAERLGADIEHVRRGIGSDPRIGYHFIYPGCGYGGSCFPKDVRALAHTANQLDYPADILQAVEAVNQRQKQSLFDKLKRIFSHQLSGKTIAVWGLAFKPNTDDMRDAPSRVLIEALWEAGASVKAFDPVAMNEARRIYGTRPDLVLCDSIMAAADQADALVICTEWKPFRTANLAELKQRLKNAIIVDGRNLYEPSQLKEGGFEYYAIGRGKALPADAGNT